MLTPAFNIYVLHNHAKRPNIAAVSNRRAETRRHLRWEAVALVVVLLAVGLAVYAFAIQFEAKSILKDVSGLRTGVSTTRDVQAIAARHKHALRDEHCEPGKYSVSFQVYNTWLYRLKLEPLAGFWAHVEAEGEAVSSIKIMLSRETNVFPTFPSAGITEEYSAMPDRVSVSTPYSFPSPVGKPYLEVVLTGQATPIQREHAYAYSLKCLIKPGGGCDLPCDYLPLAWQDWQAELEKEGWVGGFGPYYPNRSRCR